MGQHPAGRDIDELQSLWQWLEEQERAPGRPQRIRPERTEPARFPGVPGEEDGASTIPGLPSGFLAYQITFRERTVNGGGRGGTGTEQGRQAPIIPPSTDR